MPVNLLGLMAIAMFYVITVVFGLCANRCLSREVDDEDGGQGEDDVDLRGTGGLQRERESQLELVQLIEAYQSNKASSSGGGLNPLVSNRPAALPTVCEEEEIASRPPNPKPAEGSSPMVHFQKSQSTASSSFESQDSQSKWASRNCVPYSHEHQRQEYGSWRPTQSRTPSDEIVSSPIFSSKRSDKWSNHSSDYVSKVLLLPGGRYLLAERNVGVVLGSLSILAIKTGGVFSNSIAQEVFEQGLIWCQVPIASSLSLIIGGALFARNLYDEGYVTMLDPFQDIYGIRFGAIQFIPVFISDLMFCTVILSSIGGLLQITLGFTESFGVIISLISILLYLIAGGLYATTFTDAAQFIYLCLGTWLLLPFVMNSDSTKPISTTFPNWLGKVDGKHSGLYIDQMAVLILGGIPIQSYFQRVLSSKSSKSCRIITLVGCIGCLMNSVPPFLIGAAAASTEWKNTSFGMMVTGQNATTVLPISLAHLVPHGVMFLSLGALASGLLASCDSAIFGLATMLSHNIYKNWLRPQAKDKELIWITRMAVVGISLVALVICLIWPKWHIYWILPYDILYVLVFPQLFCVVYFKYSNTYGAVAGLFVGTTLRILFGEAKINFIAILPLPFWDRTDGQLFPYRTLAMLGNLLSVIFVSVLYDYLYNKGHIQSTRDIFLCFFNGNKEKERQRRRRNVPPATPSDSQPSPTQFDLRFLSGRVDLHAAVERMTVV